jgi:hypothetical protein
VPLDKERLKDATRYSSDSAPAYTDEYGRSVNEHYGVVLY